MIINNDKIILVEKENCRYIQFKKLLDYGIKHAYALKPGNYKTSGNFVDEVQLQNAINDYKTLCDCLNLDYKKIIKPIQRHTANIKCIEDNGFIDGPKFSNMEFDNMDGLITNKDEVVLATTNADCILLMFYDPNKNVIANIHSGWRGTFQKIAINTVNKMIKEYNCDPQDIICCICPSIRKCHFEVEDDVKDMCVEIFGYTNKTNEFIKNNGVKDGKNKWLVDTIMINKIMLKEIGLVAENIIDCDICSVCNKEFIHSYRAEGAVYGLGTAIISL